MDGKTYEGLLKLEERGVSVVPTTGPTPAPVPLGDVLYADFRVPAPPPRARATPTPAANGQLPPPWRGGAVGTLAQPPYAKFRDGQFSLKSAAASVGGTRDAFTFASQVVGEDADLVACLSDTSNGQVVAGLTIRAGSATATDAAHISLLYFGDDVRFMRRTHAGRGSEGGPVGGHVNLPIWMRLTRRGMYVTTYLSKDGQSWEEVGKATFTPAEGVDVFAGLAVFGTTEQLAGAHFSNVRLTTSAPKDKTDAAVTASAATTGVAAGAIAAPPAPLKRGLLLRSGTLLANADVYRADDGSVRYTKDGRGETISMVNVARILFRELTPRDAAKIPASGSGVLLKEGDFVEGEFKSLREGQVSLSSVVFGLTKFDVRTKVAALVINDPDPQRAEAIVRTSDGSTYAAKRVGVEKNRVIIEDPIAGALTVDRTDVAEILIGPGRSEPLAGVRPEKVEPVAEVLSVNPGAVLGGVTAERGIALTAGGSATWGLGGKYRALTLTCGVPAGVLPTVPVRFVVVGDGKELFRTPPRTSLSDPLAASLNVTGVKSLTLRVEGTTPDPLPTAGVWAEPSLIK